MKPVFWRPVILILIHSLKNEVKYWHEVWKCIKSDISKAYRFIKVKVTNLLENRKNRIKICKVVKQASDTETLINLDIRKFIIELKQTRVEIA